MVISKSCSVNCSKLVTALRRKKTLPPDLHPTDLHRCLGVFSLTSLCIGSIFGAGIYALTGEVTKKYAGPSVILSFTFTGIITLFATMCYAEFTARISRSGSGYLYAYYAIGELVGFITGWNMVIEYGLVAPTVAKSLSGYLDSMLNRTIEIYMTEHAPLHSPFEFVSKFPDFVALLFCLIFVILLSIGIKKSFLVNNISNVINMLTIGLVIILGFVYGKISTFTSSPFFPYGLSGTMKASATCFTAFTGFDVLSASTEEAKNPAKTIPFVMIFSLTFTVIVYTLAAFALLLLVPYSDIDNNAAFPSAFDYVGVHWAKYIVAIGAIFAMLTSLFGSLYALSRLFFSMAYDGLIFAALAKVDPKTKVPLISVVVGGIIAGVIAIFFSKEHLVTWLSIGTLITYTAVITSVVNLRYAHTERVDVNSSEENCEVFTQLMMTKILIVKSIGGTLKEGCYCLKPYLGSFLPGSVCKVAILVFHLGAMMMSLSVVVLFEDEYTLKVPCYVFIPLAAVIMLTATTLICVHNQNEEHLSFSVPCVPVLPFFAVFTNYTFLATLSAGSWARYGIFMTIGIVIYFAYGIRHSKAAFEEDSQITLIGNEDDKAHEIENELKKIDTNQKPLTISNEKTLNTSSLVK